MTCNQRCDINADGVVDARDRTILISAYGSKWGDSNYNRLCDFNGDGVVDEKDLAIFEASFGCTFDVPTPTPTPTPSPTVCTPGEIGCLNTTTKKVCKADGSGWDYIPCPSGHECIGDMCVITVPLEITCDSSTPHYSSGCKLLLAADRDNDGKVTSMDAMMMQQSGATLEEVNFILSASAAGSINALCAGCYGVAPPPVICTPGAKRCKDSKTVERCRSDGTGWDVIQTCSPGYECIKDTGLCVKVSTPPVITCNGATPHYSSGCALLLHYDLDNDGKVTSSDALRARTNGMTTEEVAFILSASSAGSINAICVGCYKEVTPPPPPPGTETRTIELTEGNHSIYVSLSGYDTLQATINVSSTGVACVSVVGGACGGTGLPRVSTSGWTVSTFLKTGTGETGRCAWIATKDTSKVVFISEMVLAYSDLKDIGFIPSASEIGDGVLMYSNLGTPESLWGC